MCLYMSYTRIWSRFPLSIYLLGVAIEWWSATILWKFHRPKWGFEQSKMRKQPSYILFKQCPRQFVDVSCCFCCNMAGVVPLPWSALALEHWRGWKASISPLIFSLAHGIGFPASINRWVTLFWYQMSSMLIQFRIFNFFWTQSTQWLWGS